MNIGSGTFARRFKLFTPSSALTLYVSHVHALLTGADGAGHQSQMHSMSTDHTPVGIADLKEESGESDKTCNLVTFQSLTPNQDDGKAGRANDVGQLFRGAQVLTSMPRFQGSTLGSWTTERREDV